MSGIADGFKEIFLAGVGAMAIGAEKSKELVDQLIAKGEITVEQGKELNAELVHRAKEATVDLRDDAVAAFMATMTQEERTAFAARVTKLAEEGVSAPEAGGLGFEATDVPDIDASEVAEAAQANPDGPR